MIEKAVIYNTVARLNKEKVGICPIEIMENILSKNSPLVFSIIDLTNDQLKYILSLNKTDKKEFAEIVEEHLIISHKFVMN